MIFRNLTQQSFLEKQEQKRELTERAQRKVRPQNEIKYELAKPKVEVKVTLSQKYPNRNNKQKKPDAKRHRVHGEENKKKQKQKLYFFRTKKNMNNKEQAKKIQHMLN